MATRNWWCTAIIALILSGAVPKCTAAQSTENSSSVDTIAAEIDRLIAKKWEADGNEPAGLSSDEEFIRRVFLDITGRIPPASDVRDFRDDASPDKRRRLVERLLASPTYIVHYTNLWRAAMLPEADADQQIRFFLPGFEAWLRSRLAENRNFAEIAREVLTLPVDAQDVQGFNQPETATPVAFYRAKEGKPENLAAATSRIFLGVRIECAQCHDHPFDDWKQDEFWGYAAFFAGVRPATAGMPDGPAPPPNNRSLMVPGTDRVVSARFLGGDEAEFSRTSSPRDVLADWFVSQENPFFARAAVNRIWAHHFGVGLVDPLDDFSTLNPPSHPELLDVLASAFVENGYDFKFMIRAITASRTYQLTSELTHESQDTPRSFARMPVRAMTPEQIFDSLAQAVGYRQPFNPEEALNFNNDPARQEFLETFRNEADSPTERASTILQALQLMNGEFIAGATDLTDSQTLAAVIDAPFLDTNEKVEALFLATLARGPSPVEAEKFGTYVASGGPTQDEQNALSDVFWALLNSSEFLMNH
ncbi:MAG: DUF1553 domain-containing protein [Planctomycetota bacterium]|nr:MAG: DUF1553 domain-containing protein [Planctomycetota bacterium]REJ90490.1 MAG: DUF1553 domain-containing protein [Planctomycetota bacterium]REK20419.1 MAG: DUF1553 domain-containing protein [Planctomycetota bacterium]REK29289.1 MAG: DUF1553 domain-containing protein [Planctomycetota bacterium]